MLRFIGGLIRPYRRTLVIIFLAMLVETVMSLATPWPLKIILDSVVGNHKLTPWLHHLFGPHARKRREAPGRCGRRHRLRRHRRHRRHRLLHRQLLHRERWPVGRARPAHADLSPSADGSRSATTTRTRPAPSSAPSPPTSRPSRASPPPPRSASSSICSPSSACSASCSGSTGTSP